MAEPTGLLPGLSEVSTLYDGILSDVWGVIHNGVAALPGAVEALRRYRRTGGRVVLVTNAPRPAPPIVDFLDALGVPRDAYDALVSSGDVTRKLIASYSGSVVHHVGPARSDDSLYAGLGVIRGEAEAARAIVVSDLDDDNDTAETYADRVPLWLERGLPMIVANPDKVVEVGGRLVYCGGALGDYYAERGGKVVMAGKPYRAIYNQAVSLLEAAAGKPVPRERLLAIGDSARTDAAGAAGFGVDFLFITGSIHVAELGPLHAPDGDLVRALVEPTGVNMVGYMPRLAW